MIEVKIKIVNSDTLIYDRQFESMNEATKDISFQIPQIAKLEIGHTKIEQYEIEVIDSELKEETIKVTAKKPRIE